MVRCPSTAQQGTSWRRNQSTYPSLPSQKRKIARRRLRQRVAHLLRDHPTTSFEPSHVVAEVALPPLIPEEVADAIEVSGSVRALQRVQAPSSARPADGRSSLRALENSVGCGESRRLRRLADNVRGSRGRGPRAALPHCPEPSGAQGPKATSVTNRVVFDASRMMCGARGGYWIPW